MKINKNRRNGLIPGKYDAVNIAISYYMIMLCIYSSFNIILPAEIMLIMHIVFYAFLINSLNVITKSFNLKHILFLFIGILVFLVSLFFSKDETVFSLAGVTIVRECIPLFFLGAAVRNLDDLLKKLKISAYIILLFTYISIFVTQSSGNVVEGYSQDVGYQNAIPFVVFLVDYMQKKEKKDILGLAFSFFAILMGGARGPILCIGIAFFLACIFLGKFDGQRSVAYFISFILIIVFISLFYQEILYGLLNLFEKFGVSTRILIGLIENDIADDSSRSTLANFAFEFAKEHPLIGTGIINDRKLLFDNLTVNTNKTVFGYYCHNFFLENLMQFGLIPGIIVCFIWLKFIIQPMLRYNDLNLRAIAIVMCTAGFLPLLVSYSYITYQYFFLMAGFMFSYRNIRNWKTARIEKEG